MAQFALAWILQQEAVSVVIPGAKNKAQADDNAAASGQPPLGPEVMARIAAIYRDKIAPHVHHRW